MLNMIFNTLLNLFILFRLMTLILTFQVCYLSGVARLQRDKEKEELEGKLISQCRIFLILFGDSSFSYTCNCCKLIE